VKDARIMMDRETGRSRGFAFVTMSSDEEANRAVGEFHGVMFMGRDLIVNEARDRNAPGAPPAASMHRESTHRPRPRPSVDQGHFQDAPMFAEPPPDRSRGRRFNQNDRRKRGGYDDFE